MTLTTIDRVVALHGVAIFADVPGRSLAAVAQRAIEVEVPAGATVIDEDRGKPFLPMPGQAAGDDPLPDETQLVVERTAQGRVRILRTASADGSASAARGG